jgi:hypothetical protein
MKYTRKNYVKLQLKTELLLDLKKNASYFLLYKYEKDEINFETNTRDY